MYTQQHLFEDINGLISFLDSISIMNKSKILVQIYTTKDLDTVSDIYNSINKLFLTPIIIGAKSYELIYNGNILDDGTLVVITVIDDIFCDVIFQTHCEFSELAIPKQLYNQPNISSYFQILSTLSPTQNQVLIDTIKDILPSTIISGGILCQDSVLFYDNNFYKQGYIGLIFYGRTIEAHQFNTTSIIPIGREHIITKAKGQQIDTIDDIPAKLFYESYLGKSIQENPDLFGYKFPLILQKDSIHLPSPVTLCDITNCIFSKVVINTGDQITLGYGDINYFLSEMKIIQDYLPTIPCEYLILFSSRKRTLDMIEHLENQQISLPIFGLLTDYEFIEDHDSCYISSETTTIYTMTSSKNSFINKFPTEAHTQPLKLTSMDTEHSVLLKLVENTSKELNTLNNTLEQLVIEKTDELLEHYYTDHLTKLPNMNRLTEDLTEDDIYCISLIDISAFININNFYGATIGNKVLKELASLIVSYSNTNNFTTYRIHSDIFAVSSYDTSFKLFTNRMRILQTKIHQHCFVSNNQQIYINTTMAISNMQLALYENTSMTLQHAKAEKIPYLIYNEHLKIEDSIISNLTWSSKIRSAIDEDRIVPFFQPIYNNELEKIDRFEVLMRLIDEDGIVVSPLQFLPIAKKAGFYDKLTKIIVQKSFEYFEDKPYKFSINLSADDVINSRTRSYIYHHLNNFSRPENVIFEIVESESIENYDSMLSFISEVKKYGAQIAIDDFGTGFSNFHYLFKLNVDTIKIDGTIIQQMQYDPSAELVAETIVSFANKLGISTVAEYVSDESIFNKIQKMGIGFAQGYFVARPASDIVM